MHGDNTLNVPYGYRVRIAISHHEGGWKKCAGLPRCRECVSNEKRRQNMKRVENGKNTVIKPIKNHRTAVETGILLTQNLLKTTSSQ